MVLFHEIKTFATVTEIETIGEGDGTGNTKTTGIKIRMESDEKIDGVKLSEFHSSWDNLLFTSVDAVSVRNAVNMVRVGDKVKISLQVVE